MKHQLLRFIAGGLAAFGINMAFLFLLANVFHVWYLWATSASFLISLSISFLLQKYWTFGDSTSNRLMGQMGSYGALAALNFIANDGLMYTAVTVIGVHHLVAQVMVSAFIAAWSFLVYRHLFFTIPRRGMQTPRNAVPFSARLSNSPSEKWHRWIFMLILVIVAGNFLAFGYNPAPPKGDAIEYMAYAHNISTGSGYSLDGRTISLAREPGYPFLLAISLSVAGSRNHTVVVIQVLLLAVTAYMVFLIFRMSGYATAGLFAACCVAVLPSYSYYANLALSETFFTTLLAISCWLVLRCVYVPHDRNAFLLLGVVTGILVLTKSHMILFPIFVGMYLWYSTRSTRLVVVSALVFVFVVGIWVLYVYGATGTVAITQGRQDLHLHARAARATLSYSEQIHYLRDWISRSATGGGETELLHANEPKAMSRQLSDLLASGVDRTTLMSRDVRVILNRPDRFLFGNVVEWTKMMFVEHLFPPVSRIYAREVRALVYFVIYGALVFSVFQCIRFRNSLQAGDVVLLQIIGIYIAYHWLVLPFFDVVPRFNTPYLVLYILVGTLGISRGISYTKVRHE